MKRRPSEPNNSSQKFALRTPQTKDLSYNSSDDERSGGKTKKRREEKTRRYDSNSDDEELNPDFVMGNDDGGSSLALLALGGAANEQSREDGRTTPINQGTTSIQSTPTTPTSELRNNLTLPTPQKLKGTNNAARNWDKLFAGNLCIGENHDEIAAKKFLIQNMKAMKELGFEVLVMEHLSEAEHQKDVDDFISGKSKEMPEKLRKYLEDLNEGHMDSPFTNEIFEEESKKYNFKTIIEAAKENKLKVICAEKSLDSYKSSEVAKGRGRIKNLNIDIKNIIESPDVKGKRWVAFVGTGHVNERYHAPGICEVIVGVQDIIIKDATEKEKSNLEVSATKKTYEIDAGEGKKDSFKTSILLTLGLDEKDVTYPTITSKFYQKTEEKDSQDSTSHSVDEDDLFANNLKPLFSPVPYPGSSRIGGNSSQNR